MATIHLNKGHNLNLAGSPSKKINSLPPPDTIKIVPDNFCGIKPKMKVSINDDVKIGTKLFFDKNNPKVYYCSPVAGKIVDVKLGDRRKIEFIEISCEGNDYDYDRSTIPSDDITREEIIEKLLSHGLWPSLRQRPFSRIAKPEDTPKSIFITAMPTAPFSLDLEFVLKENSSGVKTGLSILNKLTSGDVNVVMERDKSYTIFEDCNDFVAHEFSGPHPSGNIGVHIHHIDPISGRNDIVWYLSLQDLNDIGEFFNNGTYPTEKYISAGGSCLSEPAFYKIQKGTTISEILKDQFVDSESIIISGDVLSGNKSTDDMPINFYHETLSVIPQFKKRDFLGWILPGLKKYSLSRTFLSSLFMKPQTNFDTRINGSRRAIIPFGRWEAMLPMDLMPDIIVKSIIAKDVEDMEKYGIYECDHEDFALCAYACQSKVEVSKIIKEGLDLIESEG